LKLIISELINDSFLTFIYCSYTIDKFKIDVLDLIKSSEENMIITHYEIDNNLVAPNIIHDKSLKIKKNFLENKSIIFVLCLTIGLIVGNNMYVTNKVTKFLKDNLYTLKSKRNTYNIKNIKLEQTLKTITLNIKKDQLIKINFNNVIDFKTHYKTEIKKLF